MKGQDQRQHERERLKRKVTKAHLRLQAAQEDAAQARERGKQAIDQARLRAAEMMAKAAARVEKRAQKLTRAEERVRELEVSSGDQNGLSDTGMAGRDTSPEGTVAILQQNHDASSISETPPLVTAIDGSRTDPSSSGTPQV